MASRVEAMTSRPGWLPGCAVTLDRLRGKGDGAPRERPGAAFNAHRSASPFGFFFPDATECTPGVHIGTEVAPNAEGSEAT
jgi:hypothetical protein